jgi:flagellar basal-body rod modification protein FlgD
MFKRTRTLLRIAPWNLTIFKCAGVVPVSTSNVDNQSSGNAYLDSLRNKPSTQTDTKGSNKLDQSAFLKLLTTQLQNQDPTQPMDANSMVSQLAQLSTVTGISEINANLKAWTADQSSNRIGDAASWIGHQALVVSDTAHASPDGSFSGRVALDEDVKSMSISLVDADGKTVYSRSYGKELKGPIDFKFDGVGPDGKKVAGPLKVVVSALGSKGVVKPQTATWSAITGVQSPAGGASAKLLTESGAVAPTDVLALV